MKKSEKSYICKSLYLDGVIVGFVEIYWLTNSVRFKFNDDKYMLNLFENIEFDLDEKK